MPRARARAGPRALRGSVPTRRSAVSRAQSIAFVMTAPASQAAAGPGGELGARGPDGAAVQMTVELELGTLLLLLDVVALAVTADVDATGRNASAQGVVRAQPGAGRLRL